MTKDGNNLLQRKKNRLMNYDYSSSATYFITFCTIKRRNFFWKNDRNLTVGAIIDRPNEIILSEYGNSIDILINSISVIYPNVSVEAYVIMPDHVHLLIRSRTDISGRSMIAPTISQIIRHIKGCFTKQIGKSIWQKSFYDHIIRNKEDYVKHLKYIHDNPLRWHFSDSHNEEP